MKFELDHVLRDGAEEGGEEGGAPVEADKSVASVEGESDDQEIESLASGDDEAIEVELKRLKGQLREKSASEERLLAWKKQMEKDAKAMRDTLSGYPPKEEMEKLLNAQKALEDEAAEKQELTQTTREALEAEERTRRDMEEKFSAQVAQLQAEIKDRDQRGIVRDQMERVGVIEANREALEDYFIRRMSELPLDEDDVGGDTQWRIEGHTPREFFDNWAKGRHGKNNIQAALHAGGGDNGQGNGRIPGGQLAEDLKAWKAGDRTRIYEIRGNQKRYDRLMSNLSDEDKNASLGVTAPQVLPRISGGSR